MKFTPASYLTVLIIMGVALIMPQNVQSENVITIGPKNYLQINGEPSFVIGSYGMPEGVSLEETKAMGFNLLRCNADTKTLDELQAAGLYAWHSFGGNFDLDGKDDEKKKAGLRSTVDAVAKHPAMLMWESIDEPAWTDGQPELARIPYAGMNKGYEFLRTVEKNHPVYINQAPRNTVDTLRKYSPSADIICTDIYPVIPKGLPRMFAITDDGRQGDFANQTPTCVGQYVDKMKKVAFRDQAVFIVLQGFAWENLTPKDQFDSSRVLYPTYEQSRFMAWQAIIHGVNGLTYWGLHYTPKDVPFFADLAKVLQEVRKMEPVILARSILHEPVLRYAERGSTIDQGVEFIQRQIGSELYLITVNASIDPAGVTFAGLPEEYLRCGTLEVLGEGRSVEIENGSFHDEYDGLGVHIYKGIMK